MPINFSALTVAACDLSSSACRAAALFFQLRLLGFVVSRQFHETLIADFAVTLSSYQPLDNAADFRNAFLRLFKLLDGCGGLSLAADLVLLDK